MPSKDNNFEPLRLKRALSLSFTKGWFPEESEGDPSDTVESLGDCWRLSSTTTGCLDDSQRPKPPLCLSLSTRAEAIVRAGSKVGMGNERWYEWDVWTFGWQLLFWDHEEANERENERVCLDRESCKGQVQFRRGESISGWEWPKTKEAAGWKGRGGRNWIEEAMTEWNIGHCSRSLYRRHITKVGETKIGKLRTSR